MRGSLKVRSLECEEEEEEVKELAVIPRFIRSPPPPSLSSCPFSLLLYSEDVLLVQGFHETSRRNHRGRPRLGWAGCRISLLAPLRLTFSSPLSSTNSPHTPYPVINIPPRKERKKEKNKSDNHILVNDIYHSR